MRSAESSFRLFALLIQINNSEFFLDENVLGNITDDQQ